MEERPPQHHRRGTGTVRALVFVLAAIGLVVFGYVLGFSRLGLNGTKVTLGSNDGGTFHQLDTVWSELKKSYVKQPLDEKAAVYGALQGMVNSLHDPYTVYFTPAESKDFQNEIDGTFEGIGAEIGIKNNQLVVIAPLPESPAEKAGLVAGDAILSIDGTASSSFTIDKAVQAIRGKKGTTVKLVIQKSGQDKSQELSIIRDAIEVKSVVMKMHDSIAEIQVSYFGPKTAEDFRAAISQVLVQGAKGVILDMRSNPGGRLDAAVTMASEFVDKGNTVVTEQFNDGKKQTYGSETVPRLKGLPVVVLVDQGTASAAEIVSGALQDYHLATIVGKKTYGKGSVQQVQDFGDGSSLKVTIAKWLTPNGRSISEVGIQPDKDVEITDADLAAGRDPQLDAARTTMQGLLAK